jgi:hypothetical protein
VPSVPVGTPPTTKPAKPGKPGPRAPAPNPDAILTAVQANLDQLAAISDYKPAQAQVAASQKVVTDADFGLLLAQNVLTAAVHVQDADQAQVTQTKSQLANLAIAAYVGVGYPGIGAQPPSVGAEGPGTVGTPSGLTGVQEVDAQEMLQVVGQKAKQDVVDAQHQLGQFKKVMARDDKVVDRARAAVAGAEANLVTAQQNLKLVAEAAINPKAAASMLLPDSSGRSGSTTSTSVASLAAAAGNVVNASVTLPTPTSPSILGQSVLDGAELAAWYKSTGHKPNTTVSIDQLAADYQYWGDKSRTGVRYDVAFAQSIVETGFFSFPSYGQLTPKDNNFAGIGACDSCAHGWSFHDAKTGVGAQLELLYEYATTKHLPKGVPNEIGGTGIGGCCSTWIALAGRWASSIVYGISIMTVYNQMLSWVIPERLQQAGLIKPASTPAQHPGRAPGH